MLCVTSEEMRNIEKTIEESGITLEQMMETAGLRVAELARKLGFIDITIVAGKGNNGGDGLVAARYLNSWGLHVKIILLEKPEKESLAYRQLERLDIPVEMYRPGILLDSNKKSLVIDALIGFGLSGAPRGKVSSVIQEINQSGKNILSVDVPSGFNCKTGKPEDPCIKSHITITFVLPKKGMLLPENRKFIGRLFLADIGASPKIYKALGVDYPFKERKIIELKT